MSWFELNWLSYFIQLVKLNPSSVKYKFLMSSIFRLNVKEGDETIFLAAMGNFTSLPWWNELSECGMRPDASSLHGYLSISTVSFLWHKFVSCLNFVGYILWFVYDFIVGGCPMIKDNKWCSTSGYILRSIKSKHL